MPYQGLAFALLAGIGLAMAAYLYFLPTSEQPLGYETSYEEGETRRKRRGSRCIGNSSSDCVICQEEISGYSHRYVRKLPCGHVFHTTCIDSWARVKRECPSCRRPF